MCATVLVEGIDPAAPVWDRDRVAIVIGQGLDYFEALRQVRILLIFLGVPQMSLGATCWCGEYIAVPRPGPGALPRPRTGRRAREVHRAR